MNREDIYRMLTAKDTPLNTSRWLRETYFSEITQRFNSETSRKRFGLFQNERIPVNERNLTDVRTRMGVLIEFELARLSNELLPEVGVTDIFWSYVVANRFPDLEIRNNNGDRLLRLEIKCLQCIAEEKSANFDTLIKDIDPNTDYVVVCLWDWSSEGNIECSWDTAPMIFEVFVFHAYSLTQLRDTYWLNKPPANIGDGYQGFDIRYAVTCSNGIYSKEQGNYGKLTRIWTKKFPYKPQTSDVLSDTEKEYFSFMRKIISTGFTIIAQTHIKQLTNEKIELVENEEIMGYVADKYAYLLSLHGGIRKRQIQEFSSRYGTKIIVTMTEKYKCNIYVLDNNDQRKVASSEKPKNVINLIKRCI